jgi:hypothetical protein
MANYTTKAQNQSCMAEPCAEALLWHYQKKTLTKNNGNGRRKPPFSFLGNFSFTTTNKEVLYEQS